MQQKVLNNRYELERKIGEGGMARVYRGRDLRLSRTVAVKVLHAQYATDASFLPRFQHEAQAAANLHHHNIVDIYDVGQDGDIHYIVMEFIEGHDLKQEILRRGALPIDEAIAIIAAVADGLDAAHRTGMVHRDIKPQNIVIGSDGQVKITDFGIAKSALSTAMTETGITFGTADYLSPEQARGQPATARADIYCLGVTLYEALTGKLPFSGDNAIAVAFKHVSEAPQPPRQLNPRIPPQLEALVLQALEKDPEKRPASAREFAQRLRAIRLTSDQETVVSAVPVLPGSRPQPAAPAPVQAQGAAQHSGQTAPRVLQPPPRHNSAPVAPRSGGLGFGGFLIGLLVIGLVLGGIFLFTSGALDIFALSGNNPRATRAPIFGQTSPLPTLTVTPSLVPTAITPTVTATPELVMPSLIGLPIEQAREQLANDSLSATEEQRPSDDPIGSVIDQQPIAGEVISTTTTISLVVSSGPETVEIPINIIGMRVDNARARLEQLGFKVALLEQPGPPGSEGFVIRTDPAPGLKPSKGETVTVVYSIGTRTTMPDVTGKPIEEARRLILAAGLIVSFEDLQSCDRLPPDVCASSIPGQVVSSIPRGGERVERGTGVTLGVRAP